MAEKVTLLGYWASPFALRVKWALQLKGIQYEYVEEDLHNKSPQLLQYNPVYKKVPVLVHEGKPLAESLVILEYIDEVWKEPPLLPQDPQERAKARFWARFVDEKCVPSVLRSFFVKEEEKEMAAKDARENLKTLEGGLGGREFFGGETIGFVDVAAGWLGVWARIVEEIAEVNLIDAETLPLLDSWFKRFLELPTIKECVPPWDILLEHNRGFRESRKAAST